jgi:hypothetical protein
LNWKNGRALARSIALGAAICGASLLAGCQGETTTVARVNSQAITREAWTERTVRAHPGDLANDRTHEIGSIILFGMMTDELVKQLAASTHASPSAADITAMADLRKRDLNIQQAINSGIVTDEDIDRAETLNLEIFYIGVDGAHPPAADVEKYYTSRKAQFDKFFPDAWLVRTVSMPSEALAKQAIDLLQHGQPMQVAAQQLLNATPQQAAAQVGQYEATVEQLQRTQPAVYDALKAGQKGTVSTRPIPFKARNGMSAFAVFQIAEVSTGGQATLAQVRPLIERQLLQESHAGWQEHANSLIRDFAHKADFEVYLERYKPLIATLLMPQFEQVVPMPPPQSMVPMPSHAQRRNAR